MNLPLDGVVTLQKEPFPAVNTDGVAETNHVATHLAALFCLINLEVFAADHAGFVEPQGNDGGV